jgi:hypothetical protein
MAISLYRMLRDTSRSSISHCICSAGRKNHVSPNASPSANPCKDRVAASTSAIMI